MKKNEKGGKKPQGKKAVDATIEAKVENKYPGYKLDRDGEIVKLEVGEHAGGLYIARDHSSKYDCDIHKFKRKDSDTPVVILGSTVLDKKMKLHELGQEIIIERTVNTVNQKGQDVHNWNVYSKE